MVTNVFDQDKIRWTDQTKNNQPTQMVNQRTTKSHLNLDKGRVLTAEA